MVKAPRYGFTWAKGTEPDVAPDGMKVSEDRLDDLQRMAENHRRIYGYEPQIQLAWASCKIRGHVFGEPCQGPCCKGLLRHCERCSWQSMATVAACMEGLS